MTHPPASSPLARLARFVSRDKVGGLLLIGAALVALVVANSPLAEWYHAVAETRIGPESLHLDLTVAAWAADGLLAIFFFVVGLELKHEIVAGSLRSPTKAAVPVAAAIGGMAVPALIYVAITATLDPTAIHGWAIPSATDIAFALAILAIFGSTLPAAIRTFLLTLAVVDDLLAIIIIAAFYTSGLAPLPLFGSVALVLLFAWLARRRRMRWWLLLPVAVVAWVLMHESGVHATIAGVLLGFVVPAVALHGEHDSRTHQLEHRVRPISAGIALPIFAFFSSGVSVIGDEAATGSVLTQPVVLAVSAGLVLGKLLGVLGTTKLVTSFTRLRLADSIGMRDLIPVGFLTGIGFTVSLLIAELSFPDATHTAAAKIGILLGTAIAALLAAFSLAWNSRQLRAIDMNEDGVPDVDTVSIEEEEDGWIHEHPQSGDGTTR